jgi:hypothetical protein
VPASPGVSNKDSINERKYMILLTIFCFLGSTVLIGGIMFKAGQCDREIDLIEPEDLTDPNN